MLGCSTMKNATCQNPDCNKEFSYLPSQKRGRFCSNKCNHEFKRNVVIKEKFLKGTLVERNAIKKALANELGYFCTICGINEWNGKPLILQLDHIDGNAGNHEPSNLRLVCPNCHSQTPTYSGANRGNGRKARGLPLR